MKRIKQVVQCGDVTIAIEENGQTLYLMENPEYKEDYLEDFDNRKYMWMPVMQYKNCEDCANQDGEFKDEHGIEMLCEYEGVCDGQHWKSR